MPPNPGDQRRQDPSPGSEPSGAPPAAIRVYRVDARDASAAREPADHAETRAVSHRLPVSRYCGGSALPRRLRYCRAVRQPRPVGGEVLVLDRLRFRALSASASAPTRLDQLPIKFCGRPRRHQRGKSSRRSRSFLAASTTPRPPQYRRSPEHRARRGHDRQPVVRRLR